MFSTALPSQFKHLAGLEISSEKQVAELWNVNNPQKISSEESCLAIIDKIFPSKTPHNPSGRGDDCAELICHKGKIILSTDFFWEDVHFRRSYFTPFEVGAKALARATSDLAGAGVIPLGFSLGLMLSANFSCSVLEQIMQGMHYVANSYNLSLTGGDISKGDKLGFCVTVWGEQTKPQQAAPLQRQAVPLQRKKAQAGDIIFTVGDLGLANLGFHNLEKQGRPAIKIYPQSVLAQLLPSPKLEQGQKIYQFLQNKLAHTKDANKEHKNTVNSEKSIGLMDISDGLARDLPRLLGSFGAKITLPPMHKEILLAAKGQNELAQELVYHGGEDYGLLGTCPESWWKELSKALPEAKYLGTVENKPEIYIDGQENSTKGFDHFEKNVVPTQGSYPLAPLTLKSLISTCKRACLQGLMAGFNGNASVRYECTDNALSGKLDGKIACTITKSGAAKGALTEEDFAFVGIDTSNVLQNKNDIPSPQSKEHQDIIVEHFCGAKASTESLVHLAIYAFCPDAKVVLHTHPPKMLALSLALPQEERFKLPLYEAKAYAKMLGFVPAIQPSTLELALATAKVAQNYPAVWLENHGLVVRAYSLVEALALSEELEQLASIQLLSLGV